MSYVYIFIYVSACVRSYDIITLFPYYGNYFAITREFLFLLFLLHFSSSESQLASTTLKITPVTTIHHNTA